MGLTHTQCWQKNGIDGWLSIFKYNNLFKKIIKAIKYRLTTDILGELILEVDEQIIDALNFYLEKDRPLLFQAIPLHSKRFRERGFNQANLIIRRLKRLISITEVEYLTRTKNTLPQAQIEGAEERHKNTKGAFTVPAELNEKVIGQAFFLVDDVVTTGSTVKEAARTLKLHGASKVYVFSLAK